MTSLRLLAVVDVLSSTPARAKQRAPFSSARFAPSPDGPLTHFSSPRGEKCRFIGTALAGGRSQAPGSAGILPVGLAACQPPYLPATKKCLDCRRRTTADIQSQPGIVIGEAATSLRICSLGSGSSGNATFVAGERTRLLIDAGFSFNEITKRLESIGEHPERLDAVLVSHEHSDHVKGLPQIAKRLQCPIYITELTEQTLDWGKIEPRLETFQAGQTIDIGEIAIDSFTIPHDAVDPVAFRVRCGGLQAGVVTDLGYMTESVKHKIRGCDLLVLESNHDLDMLKVGPYPWFVKQRVMSRVGHLSNHAVSQFVATEFDLSCRWLVLAHLSESNNHPEVARLFADTALRNKGADGTRLVIAEQRRASEVFEL